MVEVVSTMFQRHDSIKDEPWTTAVACLMFMSSVLIPIFEPHRPASGWLWWCVPFILLAAGVLALTKLRAADTIRSILIVSFLGAAFFSLWGGIVAATGYTIARGMPIKVPRLISLNYFYNALVICPIVVVAAIRYQKRLREIDGPGIPF